MRRVFFNSLALVSLLILCAAAAVWALSYRAVNWVKLSSTVTNESGANFAFASPEDHVLILREGSLGYARTVAFAGDPKKGSASGAARAKYEQRLNRYWKFESRPGFDSAGIEIAYLAPARSEQKIQRLFVPFWLFVTLSLPLPLLWASRQIRRRLKRNNNAPADPAFPIQPEPDTPYR